ncbi:flavin monoamine oxidase family protein [Seonamhaeicola marinus]|uniref:NAD(P)-binding protein n=1 Tax=Seonamhaeicola marinus TaxID=1912246 RepID=A0A5D0JCM6_9FLAO|nr:FAD-dependent oxidoreductase [Seonamhaeicola marinus]TYA92317.1 NAD(P)-binding protein [Seonamhaeicola marinus]
MKSKYIIIGAGVSGLVSAYQLFMRGEADFVILEARDRIGGRVITQNNIDLGAVWFQQGHRNVVELLKHLNLGKFNQYASGKSILVYNTAAPAHYFESDQTQPSAYRISGGTVNLIDKLAAHIIDKIKLNTVVQDIKEVENKVQVLTKNGEFLGEKLIVTLPPKLAVKLKYIPELPEHLINTMLKTHTWMSNAIKVGISYERPFWREQSFSGTIIGQIGPVTELYDHVNADETNFSLMGFVNEGLRDVSPENRKERILSYLETYLGPQVRHYTNYIEKDWSQDVFTSCENLKSLYMSPQYGASVFKSFYMNDKLFFSGTETSPVFGGYLDGAVYSGVRAANYVLDN